MDTSTTTGTVLNDAAAGNTPGDVARAVAAAQAGDKAGAYRIFQTLATKNANDAGVWVWLGGTSPTLEEAEAAFQRAVLLDPTNEEANLGLRWVALRKQVVGSSAMRMPSNTDSGIFTSGRSEHNANTFNMAAGGFDQAVPASTGPLGTGFLTSTGNTGGLGTGALNATDPSLKMKVDGKGGKARSVPIGAIVLIMLALVLYAIAAYLIFVGNR